MYLARKYYFSRKPRQSLAFISPFYQDPWILILSQQSNPRPPSRQSSALTTEQVLARLNVFILQAECVKWLISESTDISNISTTIL